MTSIMNGKVPDSVEALVHALQFEADKSESGWECHKVHTLEDSNNTDNTDEEQGTET